jgi:RNA polymerase sigma factor (sigma-70 family)
MERNIIRYEFCDGTVGEYEVSDELFAVHAEMVREEKRLFWREAKWKVSREYLEDYAEQHANFDVIAHGSDPLSILIRREDDAALHKAIARLSVKQRELVENVFFDGLTMTAIAERENVSQQAISQRIATIYKKLKKLL